MFALHYMTFLTHICVQNDHICVQNDLFHSLLSVYVCVQYAAGMAAASQTIIVRTALSYQDIYEVWYLNALL